MSSRKLSFKKKNKTRSNTPKTRNSTPKTRNSTPKTRNSTPKTRNSTPKTRAKKNGGLVKDKTVLDDMVNLGVYTKDEEKKILESEEKKTDSNWEPFLDDLNFYNDIKTALGKSVVENYKNTSSNSQPVKASIQQNKIIPRPSIVPQQKIKYIQGPPGKQGPQGPPGNTEEKIITTKYNLPVISLLDPFTYSSSYFNPVVQKPLYVPPLKNLIMPQYKDKNIENQIHTYRDYLTSINAWNNLYYEKMMAFGMSRVPYTITEETKGHIRNYITALILYGMNKIISDYELRNLIENGVRDAVSYGENIKQGDSPIVIYKNYTSDTSSSNTALINTEKEKKKKKKSKKKKKLRKMKEMALLAEIKELLSQKKNN